MNKLFTDIDFHRMSAEGRVISELVAKTFKPLFEKYDTGQLTYLIAEEMSVAAHSARMDRLRREQDRAVARPAIARPAVGQWHAILPDDIMAFNQIPIDWLNAQAPVPGAAVAHGPAVVNAAPDDVEDVEF
jgi:hypothetical protein